MASYVRTTFGRTRVLQTIFTANPTQFNTATASMAAASGRVLGPIGRIGAVASHSFQVASLAAAGFAAVGVKEFLTFDDAMNNSLAIMGDVSDTMENKMANAAREVAKTTRFSSEEAADSFFYLASAGLDAEQSLEALPQVAQFATAGNFDLSTATDLLTDAQSALGLATDDTAESMENMTSVSDVLVKANQLANASVEEFSTSLTNKAAAELKRFGKDVEEGVAVLSYFADQGVKGKRAGEALAIVLRDVSRAAARNEEGFAELGIQVFDQQGNMRNLADVVGSMEVAFEDMSDAELAATLESLGLTRSVGQQISRLLGGSDAIREYERELRSAGGATETVADEKLSSFSAQWDIMVSKIKDAALELGSHLVPIILGDVFPAVQELTGFLNESFVPTLKDVATVVDEEVIPPLTDLATKVGENETAMKGLGNIVGGGLVLGGLVTFGKALNSIAKALGITAVLKGLGKALGFIGGILAGKIVGPLINLITNSYSFVAVGVRVLDILKFIGAALSGTAGAILAAVAAVVTVVTTMFIFRDEIRDFVSAFVDRFGFLVSYIAQWALMMIAPLIHFVGLIIVHWETIKNFVLTAWNIIRDGAVTAWNFILNFISTAISVVGDVITTVVGFIIDKFFEYKDVAIDVFFTVKDAIVGFVQTVISIAVPIINTLVDVLGTIISVVMDVATTIGGFIADVIDWFTNLDVVQGIIQDVIKIFDLLKEEGGKIFEEIIETGQVWLDFFRDIFGKLIGFVTDWLIPGLWMAIRGVAAIFIGGFEILKILGPIFMDFITDVGGFLSDLVSLFVDAFMAIGVPVFEFTKKAANWLGPLMQDIMSFFVDVVVGGFNLLITILEPVVSWLLENVIMPVFNWLKDVAPPIISGIVEVFKFSWNRLVTVMTPIINTIIDIVKAVLDNVMRNIGIWKDLLLGIWDALWGTIGATVKLVWDLIFQVIKAAILIISNIIQLFLNLLQGDVGEAWNNIWNIIKTVIGFIIEVVDAFAKFVVDIIKVAFNLIKTIATTVWNSISSIIRLAADIIIAIFRGIWSFIGDVLVPQFMFFWNIIRSVWTGVRLAIEMAWNFIRNNIFNPIWNYITETLVPIFFALKNDVTNIWRGIRDTIRRVWRNDIKPIWEAVINFIENNLIDKFVDAKNRISDTMSGLGESLGSIFGGIVTYLKGQLNSIIDFINTVINGVQDLINVLPGVDIDLPNISNITGGGGGSDGPVPGSAHSTRGFASGGQLPADLDKVGPFMTNGIRAIVGEGNSMHPEFVIPTDPKFRARALGLFASLGDTLLSNTSGMKKTERSGPGVPGFAIGGLLPDGDGLMGGMVDAAVGASPFGAAIDAGSDLFEHAVNGMVDAAWGAIEELTDPALNALPAGIIRKMAKGTRNVFKDFIRLQDDDLPDPKDYSAMAGAGGGGAGVQQWRDVALAALAYTGHPYSWIDSLMRRMNQESGGNPNAINLWDSNFVAGMPSQGLMQTIPPTFNAYAGELRGEGITDPFANIVAAIRYTVDRYGSGPAGWDTSGGYAKGSWRVNDSGMASIHKGEAILPAARADQFRDKAVEALLEEDKEDKTVNVTNNFYGVTDYKKMTKEISNELTWTLKVAG